MAALTTSAHGPPHSTVATTFTIVAKIGIFTNSLPIALTIVFLVS